MKKKLAALFALLTIAGFAAPIVASADSIDPPVPNSPAVVAIDPPVPQSPTLTDSIDPPVPN